MPSETMTTASTENEIELAREALAAAERELQTADAEVEAARERQGLGLAARGATIKAQVARARRQEAFEVARGRLKGLEKQLLAERERLDADKARAAAERGNALRAAGALLSGQIGATLARFLDNLEELEEEARRFNSQANMPVHFRLRPISDYSVLSDRLVDSVNQLLRVYPAPSEPASTTNPTKED